MQQMVQKSKPKRCYIYTRVSTSMQIDGYSLEAQEDYLRREAEHKGYQIAEIFSDEGKSGKNTTGRPEFQEMIRRITEGNPDDVEYVYVFKLSRFGRNTADVMYNIQLMEDYGVKLFAVADGIDSGGPAGKILVPVMSAVAEIERENILAQTMAGRRQKAKDGKWNGGQAPFGYVLQDGILYIDETEAQIIRIIYDRFLNHNEGANGVAKWLNRHGYKKKIRGNGKYEEFSAHFVKIVLDNPVYMGKIAYGRRKTEKINGTRNEFHKVKKEEYDLWDGKHEAIIDESTWNAAQLKRKVTGVKKERTHSLDHEHVLSGILKCPRCGGPMYGRPGRKKRPDGTYYESSLNTFYYVCKHRTTEDGYTCNFNKYIKQEDVDGEVWDLIAGALESGGFDTAIQTELNDQSDPDILKERLKTLKENRHKTVLVKDRRASEIDRLDVTDPAYNIKLADLQTRLDALYEEIVGLDNEIKMTELEITQKLEAAATREDAHAVLQYIVDNSGKLTSADLKAVVNDFVKEVQIYPEKTDDGWVKSITFNFDVVLNGEVGKTFQHQETTDETVALLSKGEIDSRSIQVELSLEDMDLSGFQSNVTYNQIKEWVKEQTGLRVSSLYIAQVKRKYGLAVGPNQNPAKAEGGRVPQCPPEKEAAIKAALEHFRLLPAARTEDA